MVLFKSLAFLGTGTISQAVQRAGTVLDRQTLGKWVGGDWVVGRV